MSDDDDVDDDIVDDEDDEFSGTLTCTYARGLMLTQCWLAQDIVLRQATRGYRPFAVLAEQCAMLSAKQSIRGPPMRAHWVVPEEDLEEHLPPQLSGQLCQQLAPGVGHHGMVKARALVEAAQSNISQRGKGW